jgi:hypothetical protein
MSLATGNLWWNAMKRRCLLVILPLLLLLGGLLLVPSVRWPLYGWLRGVAFYTGMATTTCPDTSVLEHCLSDGAHVRGRWLVDLVLRKE